MTTPIPDKMATPVPDEKAEVLHLDEKGSDSDRISSSESQERYSAKDYAKIRRRIDYRLIPCLGAMYGISLMDRKNVSNAAIAGMTADLELGVGYRYSLITLSFFITYVIFQPPTTVLCRKIGPRIFLPAICLLWGAIIIGFGFAKNWSTLVALRLILGILEAGYFPGCVYLISTWYTRYHVGKRYSIFYFIGSLASALSGILAYGLMQMEGTAGIRGWQWIFIMEGVITCGIAILSYIFICRFPDQEVKKPSFGFLKPDEAQFICDELDKDRADVEPEKFNIWKFLAPAKEIEIWGFALIFFMITTVTYSFAFFMPIILRDGLGFSVAASQCLVAPPYVLSGLLMYATSWAGDKYKMRMPMLVLNTCISLVGLPMMAFATSQPVRYVGVFIGVAGVNANVPTAMAYQANNIRGQWKRAFCSATLVGFGGIGGISGSLIFRSQDAPEYVPGFIGVIVANTMVAVIAIALTFLFKHRNKLADQGKLVINGSPEFRYTL